MTASEAKDAAGLGLSAKDYEGERDFYVWPDNWKFVQLFDSLGTQWVHGPNGPTGLNYQSLPWAFERKGLSKEEWDEAFTVVQMMEIEALKEIHG